MSEKLTDLMRIKDKLTALEFKTKIVLNWFTQPDCVETSQMQKAIGFLLKLIEDLDARITALESH